MNILRTDSSHKDFISLVKELDADLYGRYGDIMVHYDQFNGIERIRHSVVLYVDGVPAACGAFKKYDAGSAEIKRVFVSHLYRKRGLARALVEALELWAAEEGYGRAILETGSRQPEAIGLYKKSGYRVIPNYPPYADDSNSVCMEKELNQ